MPSQYDNTYHFEYSKPTYDTVEDKIKFQTIREADEVLELKTSREPTREEEIQYLDWLESEFASDPWITHRFRKYTASPKRWAWKNAMEQKRDYQSQMFTNYIFGFLLTWPLGVYVGRSMQTRGTGVPSVPLQKYLHDFYNLDPSHYSRKLFRRYFFITCSLGGVFFAYATVENRYKNPWYSRPDLKPFPAMVAKDHLDRNEKQMYETNYRSYHQEEAKMQRKNSTWYRLLFPNDALFDAKKNTYHGTHKENNYNPANGYYSNPGNVHYRHHLNE
ncbi:UNKNOWN [Stylonychia lemnae]|uniref:Uncharacterized protein n=1 Tax=Stylonychia lemnae TaxID=5949 RepID=A0A078A500_STYLE|nr:UNKNOWN [Stylonychia lemnae]|eukprot:CDW76650.1 UNKNOWN [Stylonychia lemnae]